MTSTRLSEIYPHLPGPARFIKDVAGELIAGKSVVIVFPEAMVASGAADTVLADIAREGVSSEYCEVSAEPFHTRVLMTFGADPVLERAYDEWDTIIEWSAWHGSWVLLPGWKHSDVAEILSRWPAQLTACGLDVEDRPKLVVGVTLADISRRTLTHLDRSATVVRWWWGVLDRLDTESLLVAVSECRLDPVSAAVVTELSSWDLEFTVHLVEHWDRTTNGLLSVTQDYQDPRTDACSPTAGTGRVQRGRLTAPPAELEKLWRDGLVDWWSQSVRWAPAILDRGAIDQRVWMAHNRVLMPHIDEERSHFEAIVRAKATRRSFDGLYRRDDDIIEIGSLAWLVECRRIDIGSHNRKRLQTFRELRNVLAHRNPVPDELLRQVCAYLKL